MLTIRMLNKWIKNAQAHGKNIYARGLPSRTGLLLIDVQMTKAKSAQGVPFVQSVTGQWYKVFDNTLFEEK